MWLMTNRGFYSVVDYVPSKDLSGRKLPGEGPWLLVRSRRKEDLQIVVDTLEVGVVEKDNSADYMFRMVIPAAEWQAFLVYEAMRIDYSNFKNSVKDHDLHNAYMSVWGVMNRLQPRREYKFPSSNWRDVMDRDDTVPEWLKRGEKPPTSSEPIPMPLSLWDDEDDPDDLSEGFEELDEDGQLDRLEAMEDKRVSELTEGEWNILHREGRMT